MPEIATLSAEIWDNQVATMPESGAAGLLSRGNLTLLTSMWKAGQRTLLSHSLGTALRASLCFRLGRAANSGTASAAAPAPRARR